MMIPPVIRLGPPPEPQANHVEYVCLVQGWGWAMMKWHPRDHLFYFSDNFSPHPQVHYRHPHEILCWMPQDGS